MSLQELQQYSRWIREHDRTLVLTNGCFDLIHVGHVRYLEAARSMGDALVVAVNSDRSVRAIKGDGRPLTREADRLEIVAALESVDRVVLFDAVTATDVVSTVRPAIYVKGADYSPNPEDETFPPEGAAVLAYGGMIRIVPYQDGYSTSRIVRDLTSESTSLA